MERIIVPLYRHLRIKQLLRHSPKILQAWANRIRMKRSYLMLDKLVPEEELALKFREGLCYLIKTKGADAVGDYLEFGVYNGTSLMCMHRVLEDLKLEHIRLFGFDSFEGFPVDAEMYDEGYWHPGDYKCEYEFTKYVLERKGVDWKRVFLIKGFYDTTLKGEVLKRYCLRKAGIIMIDCDLYSSAKQALEFCGPLIKDEAMIVFDDWNPLASRNLGEKKAFDEFLTEQPYFDVKEFGTYTSNAQIFLISRKPAFRDGIGIKEQFDVEPLLTQAIEDGGSGRSPI